MVGIKVRRQEAVFVVPENPTKNETLELSDIDDQQGLRLHAVAVISFKGRPSNSVKGKKDDPAKVIKEALANTLNYYYPFAGRLRETDHRKLVVDCNAKGVLFIEADANVTFNDIHTQILPPCPLLDDLLFDVPGSSGIIDCPLLLFQVTRLICGGHILVIRFNHTMCDMLGFMQFLYAMVELSRGAHKPSVMPVWQRELLRDRDPPTVTCTHHEYEKGGDKSNEIEENKIIQLSRQGFLFGPVEVEAIRNHLPLNLGQSFSTFELLCASIWTCRVKAMLLDPDETVQFCMSVSLRENNIIVLPSGYHGNSFVWSAITTKVKNLMNDNSLTYALQLVKQSRDQPNEEEYVRSMIDHMVVEGRPNWKRRLSWNATNLTRKGLEFVDFGWGKPSYAGVPRGTSVVSTFTRFKNDKGEDVIAVDLSLPKETLSRFQNELGIILGDVSPFISHRSKL